MLRRNVTNDLTMIRQPDERSATRLVARKNTAARRSRFNSARSPHVAMAEPFSSITLNTPSTAMRKCASKDALAFLSEVAAAARDEESTKRGGPARGRKKAGRKGPAAKLSASAKLELLAMSFKLEPSPSAQSLQSLAARVGMTAADLEEWFERRRRLESWARQHPQLKASHIAAALSSCRLQEQHRRNHGTSETAPYEWVQDTTCTHPVAVAFVS